MDQQPMMQNHSNTMPGGIYPPASQMAQQQWPGQPAMYPPAPSIPLGTGFSNSQLQDPSAQFYYQQQPTMPPKALASQPQTNAPPADLSSNPNAKSYLDASLHSKMSDLSLDGETTKNTNAPKSDIYSSTQNSATSFVRPSNTQNVLNPVASSGQSNYQPPSQQHQPLPISNYNGSSMPAPPPPVAFLNSNYNNYNQPPPLSMNSSQNSWASNAPPPVVGGKPAQPPMYNNEQNGQLQNYPPNSVYGSYQPQPGPPLMTQNFATNRYSTTPAAPGYGGGFPQVSPQQNRLDPEAMPSVVQVILEDKAKYESSNNVLFTTTVPATVPPLVTTVMESENQVVEDGGSARSTFIRPSIYQVPVSEDSLKTSDIPFGLVIKPFDDQEVEGKIYVPVSTSEIVRCNRCKGYMNPYNRFIDGGRRFQCSLCHHVTDVPPNYFSNLDHTGQRLDKFQRVELYLGSYEFKATEEYCRNSVMNNRRPHIIFACELTETSKPILHSLADNLVEIINNFPKDPLSVNPLPPLVGFVTYNSKIQLYDIVNNGHAHVVCDLSTPFPPLNTFLVDPLIHMDKIESFLKGLPQLYANEELEMQTILGPVIEAALMTTQVDINNWINQGQSNKIINDNQQNQTYETIPVGKVYMFHCTLPTYGSDADTPGRLKQRWTNSVDEIRKLLGTDKEKTILSPESNKYYVGLGQKCVTDFASGIELFLFPPANAVFMDVATLGELTRLTGTGAVFKYFNDFSDNFLVDLKYSLYSSFAFDCVLKVRTSTGIRPHDYYGNFYSRSPNDIECAAINTNTNIAVEFKYDDKLSEDEHVVVQTAILYTSLSGERRVRLHNIALATCQQIGDIYRSACCDTVVNLIARNAVHSLRRGDKTIQQTKEAVINRVINILTSYRKHCAQPGTSLGQLILPEALKLLPMYTCGLLKCDAIDGGPEMSPDDKAYAQLKLLGSFPSLSQVFLYPRLYKIEYESEGEDTLKYSQIRCSSHKLSSSALCYVLENGFYILVFLTSNGCNNSKFLHGIFGPSVDSAVKIPVETGLPNLLTNESQFMNRLIKKMEYERKCSYKVFLIRQGIDKIESVFKSFLYEDQKVVTRNAGESKLEGLSYVDLLCHLHKEIRAQLN